jgi:hypothetical protein
MKRIDKFNMVQQKWDYFIILDARRYDYKEEIFNKLKALGYYD